MPEPKCWADLLKPEFKGEVQVANPNSSGTAYTLLATLVQLMGEDKALRVSEGAAQEHQPVHQVGRSAGQGRGARRDRGRHHLPCTTPCRWPSTGRPVEDRGAMRRHRLRDRLDVDHQGRAQSGQCQEVLRLGADAGGQNSARRRSRYQVPSNKAATVPPEAPKLAEIKLIDYDFAKYGSSAERRRLLSKWDNEVKNLPK